MTTEPLPLPRVVVTGAAGIVGRAVRAGLECDHVVIPVDRRRRGTDVRLLDTRNRRRARRLFAGADAVVDLAAIPRVGAPWSDILDNNLRAATTCFEVAAELGIRRVVYASSNHATGLFERDEPYASVLAGRHDGLHPDDIPLIGSWSTPRPDSPYGVSKIAAELAGRMIAETTGVSVICLRLGHVLRDDRPVSSRDFATYLSKADLVRLVRCALAAPDNLRFGVVYGVSANTWRIWDIAEARTLIGYEPLDDAERHREPSVNAPEATTAP